MKFTHQRRAVDSIIATVLIISVTVLASLAVSGYVFGVLGHYRGFAQVAVTGTALQADDFTSGGASATFTCATTASADYLTLTNSGIDGASVASISITWAGGSSQYSLFGDCNLGSSWAPSSTQYVVFPAGTTINPSAIPGQTYTGTVTLSNGALVLFTSNWQ